MSSLEIAELTGKRRDNVMVDIAKMLEGLNFPAPEFSGTLKSERDVRKMLSDLDIPERSFALSYKDRKRSQPCYADARKMADNWTKRSG